MRRISAVATVRPTRSTSTRTCTGPATAAERKCVPQVSTSGWPTFASPEAAPDAPSAISTPPLMAWPINQPSPRWPRAIPTAPGADGPTAGAVLPLEGQDLVELTHRSASPASSVVPSTTEPMVTP